HPPTVAQSPSSDPSWSPPMAKSSVAVRSPRSKPAPAAPTRLRAVADKPEARKRLAPVAETPVPAPALPNPQLLRDDELEAIWKTYKRTRDDNLRNILIEHHMPLVRMIAERVLQTLPKSIELDDLSSAGTFGLMDAINGFDLTRGIKFKTYCTTRIRGSILDELRSPDWVPRLGRLKAHKLERAMRQLEGELGRMPNQAELAHALGMTMDDLQAHQNEASAKTIFSLSEKWDDGDDDKEMEKVEILADK